MMDFFSLMRIFALESRYTDDKASTVFDFFFQFTSIE